MTEEIKKPRAPRKPKAVAATEEVKKPRAPRKPKVEPIEVPKAVEQIESTGEATLWAEDAESSVGNGASIDLPEVQIPENDNQSQEDEFESADTGPQLRVVGKTDLSEIFSMSDALIKAKEYCGTDIIKRARFMQLYGQTYASKHLITSLPKTKSRNANLVSENSTHNVHAAMFMLCGLDRDMTPLTDSDLCEGVAPFMDTFSGRLYQYRNGIATQMDGKPSGIVTGNWPRALEQIWFSGVNSRAIQEGLLQLAYENKENLVSKRLIASLPAWDGVNRVNKDSNFTLDLLRCSVGEEDRDSQLKNVLKYFWWSIYHRATNPGCEAPVTLVLLGPQNCGKSTFLKLINSFVKSPDRDLKNLGEPAVWDFKRDHKDNMRALMGSQFIWGFPEMADWSSASVEYAKTLLTQTEDTFDPKMQRSETFQRQFIFAGDSNKPRGLTRDASGERRIMAVYCTTDRTGVVSEYLPEHAATEQSHKIRKLQREEFLQMMAEIRESSENYSDVVRAAIEATQTYMAVEVEKGRTDAIGDTDINFEKLISRCTIFGKIRERSTTSGNAGEPDFFLSISELVDAYRKVTGSKGSKSYIQKTLAIELGKPITGMKDLNGKAHAAFRFKLESYFVAGDVIFDTVMANVKKLDQIVQRPSNFAKVVYEPATTSKF